MNIDLEKMREKKQYYDEIAQKAKASLREAPEKGRLKVQKCKGTHQYFVREEKNETWEYIDKSRIEIVRRIAQRDYDKKVLNCAKEWSIWIDQTMKNMPKRDIRDISYQEKNRKDLISVYEVSDEVYIRQWESVSYTGKGFASDAPEIYTERGERVRSKSEKIIADKLLSMKIPYKYEAPIYLNGYGTIFPDFTLLDVKNRKEVYLEHLGMMGSAEYSEKAITKIHQYEKNEIFPGDRLLLTFETSVQPLDSRLLEKMLRHFLLWKSSKE